MKLPPSCISSNFSTVCRFLMTVCFQGCELFDGGVPTRGLQTVKDHLIIRQYSLASPYATPCPDRLSHIHFSSTSATHPALRDANKDASWNTVRIATTSLRVNSRLERCDSFGGVNLETHFGDEWINKLRGSKGQSWLLRRSYRQKKKREREKAKDHSGGSSLYAIERSIPCL